MGNPMKPLPGVSGSNPFNPLGKFANPANQVPGMGGGGNHGVQFSPANPPHFPQPQQGRMLGPSGQSSALADAMQSASAQQGMQAPNPFANNGIPSMMPAASRPNFGAPQPNPQASFGQQAYAQNAALSGLGQGAAQGLGFSPPPMQWNQQPGMQQLPVMGMQGGMQLPPMRQFAAPQFAQDTYMGGGQSSTDGPANNRNRL